MAAQSCVKSLLILGNEALITAIEDSLSHDKSFWQAMLADTYGIAGEESDDALESMTVLNDKSPETLMSVVRSRIQGAIDCLSQKKTFPADVVQAKALLSDAMGKIGFDVLPLNRGTKDAGTGHTQETTNTNLRQACEAVQMLLADYDESSGQEGDVYRMLTRALQQSSPEADAEMPVVTAIIEGGCVQTFVSDHPQVIGRTCAVIDYDTDGLDDTDMTEIQQPDGTVREALYSDGYLIEASAVRVKA